LEALEDARSRHRYGCDTGLEGNTGFDRCKRLFFGFLMMDKKYPE
jgi:hypothetical protein